MRKNIVFLAAVLFAMFIMVLNLPPNDVKNHFHFSAKTEMPVKMAAWAVLSQTVANWRYHHFGIIKTARSDRLETTVIGLPFVGWVALDSKFLEP